MAYNLDSLYNFPLWAKPADRLFSGSLNKNPLCHCTYECILVGSPSPIKSLGDHSPGHVCNYRGNMMHCHLAKLVSEFWLSTGEPAKAFCFQSLIWWFIIFFTWQWMSSTRSEKIYRESNVPMGSQSVPRAWEIFFLKDFFSCIGKSLYLQFQKFLN